jgi:hypothetical protein
MVNLCELLYKKMIWYRRVRVRAVGAGRVWEARGEGRGAPEARGMR